MVYSYVAGGHHQKNPLVEAWHLVFAGNYGDVHKLQVLFHLTMTLDYIHLHHRVFVTLPLDGTVDTP